MGEAGPVAPLYPMYNKTQTNNGGDLTIAVTNGNHVELTTSANSRNCYWGITGNFDVYISYKANKTTIFSLAVGDEWELRIKNITYQTGESASNYFSYRLVKRESNVNVVTSGNIYGSGDKTFTGTISEAANISCAGMTVYRSSHFSFDVEFYVNGVRYI